jgi:hypothetical protein
MPLILISILPQSGAVENALKSIEKPLTGLVKVNVEDWFELYTGLAGQPGGSCIGAPPLIH